jgi:hypothetical protein
MMSGVRGVDSDAISSPADLRAPPKLLRTPSTAREESVHLVYTFHGSEYILISLLHFYHGSIG